ncbi:BlaI/MecI/CopY family transcriptional regulator [Isosphaeraceae bacterium EP7]
MARPASELPTDGEWAILRALWDLAPATLGEVREGLRAAGKPAATTTVATILKVMERKGLVTRDAAPRGARWSPVPTRDSAASGLLTKVMDAAFDGSARRLAAHLIEQGALTRQDRDAIRAMLDAAPDDPEMPGR